MHSQTTMGNSPHEREFYLVASGISLSVLIRLFWVECGHACMAMRASIEMTSRHDAPDTVSVKQ